MEGTCISDCVQRRTRGKDRLSASPRVHVMNANSSMGRILDGNGEARGLARRAARLCRSGRDRRHGAAPWRGRGASRRRAALRYIREREAARTAQLRAEVDGWFAQFDTNRDGKLQRDELRA